MFKKILIPADGSPISAAAAHAGVDLAKQIKADVIGIYVAPKYQYPVYVEIIPPNYPSEEEYVVLMRKTAEGYFRPMREDALAAGLNFEEITEFSDSPAQQIVRTAEQHGCDLIFMGSHGRGGLGQLLLGSVTAKVLSACNIPVLVHRLPKHAANLPGS